MRVVDDVARDVGELEGDTEIGGAPKRVLGSRVAVGGSHAHDVRHHHAHRAGDLVAIAEQVGLGRGGPAGGVALEPGEVVGGEAGGDRAFGGDGGEGVERGEPGRPAGERVSGCRAEEGDALGGVVGGDGVVAERLAVGDIVAGAAPGV